MFNKNDIDEVRPGLVKAIDEAFVELATLTADTEEYNTVLEKIERLYKLLPPSKEARKRVSPDSLIAAGSSLAGIGLIMGFERMHVLGTKALGFVTKVKL